MDRVGSGTRLPDRGSNCREIVDNVTDMAHFFYIHFGLPTYFKNVFEGHIASQYLHNGGRPTSRSAAPPTPSHTWIQRRPTSARRS